MNERIHELIRLSAVPADQAEDYAESKCLIEPTEKLDVAKFAELIVGECIRKIEDIAESSKDPQPIYRVAVELLEHFGVEE